VSIQCIIPAAGSGVRFNELGKIYPKTLLPVDRKPILFHTIDALLKDVRISKITVVTPRGGKITFQDTLIACYKNELKSEFIEVVESQDNLLGKGPAGSIISGINKNFDSYLVILSDIIPKFDFEKTNFSKSFVSTQYVEDWTRWCLITYDSSGKVVFSDKPTRDIGSRSALSGVYFFHKGDYFNEVCESLTAKSFEHEFEISKILEQYSKKIKIYEQKKLQVLNYGTLQEYIYSKGKLNSRNFNTISEDIRRGFVIKQSNTKKIIQN